MSDLDYVGKICPVCREEIKVGEKAIICPSCNIPHHTTCWESNKGCSTFGCNQQGTFKSSVEDKKMKEDSIIKNSSLIKCKDCGQLISGKARVCVHCGCPTEFTEAKVTKATTCETFLRVIAILTWIIGSIAGVFLSFVEVGTYYHRTEFSLGMALMYWSIFLVVGLLIMGLADVIGLLSSIDYEIKRQ